MNNTTTTLTLIFTAVVGMLVMGADAPGPTKLTNEERLTFENIALRKALTEQQLSKLAEEQQTAFKAVCERAKVPVASCQIDPQTLTVTAKPTPAPAK